jgi:hypothetical protein
MVCAFFLRDSLPWLQWLHWCREHDVDTVLAILAIIFATIQFVDSRLQEHLMKEQRLRMLNQSNQMEGLAKSMSTRFVGNFPLNMSEIVDVVSKTDARLDIMCDVAAYGHYSQPTLFANYRNHIQAKRSANIDVRLIVYANDIYERLLSERFAEAKFEDEKKSARLNLFFKSNPQHNLPETHADFLAALRQEQLSILRSFMNSGVKVKTVTDTRLLSMWLEDDEDVVFGFQNPIDTTKEVSFRSRDGNLIKVMHDVFEEAWSRGVDMPRV